MTLSRRTFVSTAAFSVFGLSGCSSMFSSYAFRVLNATSTEISADIRVVRITDEQTLLQETLTLPPEDGHEKTYNSVINEGDEVRIHISVTNGPEDTFEYDYNDDAKMLDIFIHSDEIEYMNMIA